MACSTEALSSYITGARQFEVGSLVSFTYVENSLHLNFADFAVNFIKQFVSCFCCKYNQEYCTARHGSVDILCG